MTEANLPDKATQSSAPPASTADLSVVASVAAEAVDVRRDCFVIMPFSNTEHHNEEYWAKHFAEFLCPLVDEHPKLKARRSEALRGDIGRDIITSLVNSPIVVAELTDLNPNVFWELGVRQSFKHGTVTIAEEGTKLPFDIITKGTLFYRTNDHIQEAEFRRRFKAALADCLINPAETDSSVLETISGRSSLYAIIRRDEILRRIDAVISESESNADAMKQCAALARNNLVPECKQPSATNLRLRNGALEHLIIERYLDFDSRIYAYLEKRLAMQQTMNNLLSGWSNDMTGNSKRLADLAGEFDVVSQEMVKMLQALHKIHEASR